MWNLRENQRLLPLDKIFLEREAVTVLRHCARFCSIPVFSIPERNRPMVFTKRLREGVISGEITCSVRIWVRPMSRSARAIAWGRGDRNRFHHAHRPSRHYFGTGARIGISGCPRFTQSRETRQRRQDLSDPVSLPASTGKRGDGPKKAVQEKRPVEESGNIACALSHGDNLDGPLCRTINDEVSAHRPEENRIIG